MKLKYCEHCGNEILTTDRRANLMNRFEELHGMGAEAFGLPWLKANECAVSAARALEIEASDPDTRALLSLACYRILSAILPPKETKKS